MTKVDSDDPLLAALDHFTNAVAWLQPRTSITAGEALVEAVADWLVRDGHPAVELADLATALGQLLDHREHDGTAAALTEALSEWTAALSAEHNASRLFQPSRGPTLADGG